MKMETIYLKVNARQPEEDKINRAADLILNAETVAFPTETVYGLGALASSSWAVEKIFQAKNRPPQNPLLVHVSNKEQAELVAQITSVAKTLMAEFWPGPLSIILPARKGVPSIITGGKKSVGLRMPSHPVALKLIDKTGPLAAPSANLSGRPSPVTADHVRDDLDGRIAAVLDAGPTGSGLESTIIDLSTEPFKVLRRGGLAVEKLEATLGQKLEVAADFAQKPHYQVKTKVLLCPDETALQNQVHACQNLGQRVAVVYNRKDSKYCRLNVYKEYYLNLDDDGGEFYFILRDAELNKVKVLLFAPLPQITGGTALSLMDRIKRASSSDPGIGEN